MTLRSTNFGAIGEDFMCIKDQHSLPFLIFFLVLFQEDHKKPKRSKIQKKRAIKSNPLKHMIKR